MDVILIHKRGKVPPSRYEVEKFSTYKNLFFEMKLTNDSTVMIPVDIIADITILGK